MAKILIVDDHTVNREFLVTLRGYKQHFLLEASDGVEALVKAGVARPDLIIADILMPTMDGYEFVRRLRADPRIAATPVIFYTAHYHKQEAQELARSCGVAHILIKPCEPEVILKTVEEALGTPLQITSSLAGQDFDYEHLRVITDKLSEKADRLQVELGERERLEKALREREAGLRRAQVMAKLAHVITGPEGAFESWSETLPKMIGTKPGQMPKSTRDWLNFLHPEDQDRFREKSIAAARTNARVGIDYRLRGPDGGWIQIQQVIEPIEDDGEAGGKGRWFSTLQDVTDQKNAEGKIRRLNRVYAMLSGINTLIVRVRNRDELLNEACRIAVNNGHFGMVWVGMIEQNDHELRTAALYGFPADFEDVKLSLQGPDAQQWGPALKVIGEKKIFFDNDIASQPKLNRIRQIAVATGYRSLAVLPLVIEKVSVGVMFLYAREPGFFNSEEIKLMNELAADISFALEHIVKADKLDYLAYYDELTGLPNRTLLQDYLGRVVRRGKDEETRAAVVMCDIKRFSHVNETLGREAGDALLQEFGRRLKKVWPEPDNVGRISADCFGGIVAGIKDAAEIAHLIESPLALMLNEPFEIGGEKLRISVTIGIAIFPTDGDDTDALFKNAEAALKKAKAGGDKYLFYHSKMNAAVTETLRLENNLRRAIEKEEFVLFYQPKLDLAKGHISGLEALIRWNDPETGLVPPVKFIPLLEETGMILEVGAWAIQKALHDYREWYIQGLQPPRIAVNVSSVQLRQKNFVEVVSKAIRDSKAMPHGLDLEITESLIMEDIGGSVKKLKALRDMGINIAIDDFGTGYSSLGYLARLPVNLLKIDRSFIITMTQDGDSMAIVSTIISLAHSLGMKVIAEGVETEEQSRFLKLLKCDEMQGYLFSKPLPMDQLTKMLEERRES
jgi:diguanylate cyclase (GGDEF)-like protein/PAS domain S-box-containing protein